MVMGGASGALRQEFRELELLDDIIRLKYNGRLPHLVMGDHRNDIIGKFRDWKGEHYIPKSVHKAIHWGKSDPFLMEVSEDLTWHIVPRSKQNGTTKRSASVLVDNEVSHNSSSALHTSPHQNGDKRKLEVLNTTGEDLSPPPAKRTKQAVGASNFNYHGKQARVFVGRILAR
jgi:hypothetical protein